MEHWEWFLNNGIFSTIEMVHTPEMTLYTVEPPIKDTPNKEHLSIKDKSTCPNSYYTSTF